MQITKIRNNKDDAKSLIENIFENENSSFEFRGRIPYNNPQSKTYIVNIKYGTSLKNYEYDIICNDVNIDFKQSEYLYKSDQGTPIGIWRDDIHSFENLFKKLKIDLFEHFGFNDEPNVIG